MWSGQWPGPESAGSCRAWASNMTIVLRAGPGLDILFAGRAGPGPHKSVCEPGPGRVCTTAAGSVTTVMAVLIKNRSGTAPPV